MKKQKICIIGGSLTGLVTAISLSRLNCEIDLIIGNSEKNIKSNRTIAISDNNFKFLNNLKFSKFLKKELWPCSLMKLYSETKNKKSSEIFHLRNNDERKILYMMESSKIIRLMMKKIKKINSISIKKNNVLSIYNSGHLKSVKFKDNVSRYNLVVICVGNNTDLIKNLFKDKIIENSYEELAITTTLRHNSLKNNIVRQFFFKNEILALLPLSNNKTSIVWITKNHIKKNNILLIKKKIKSYLSNYLKNIKFLDSFKYKDLKFLIRNKYYLERTLLFGDALHVIHPFVGQGFNMTLRDLENLEKILRKKIDLGLDIGSLDVLNEFSKKVKVNNFIFSVGVDFLKSSFSIENKYFKSIRNNLLKKLNKSTFAKNKFFNIADKGFNI